MVTFRVRGSDMSIFIGRAPNPRRIPSVGRGLPTVIREQLFALLLTPLVSSPAIKGGGVYRLFGERSCLIQTPHPHHYGKLPVAAGRQQAPSWDVVFPPGSPRTHAPCRRLRPVSEPDPPGDPVAPRHGALPSPDARGRPRREPRP